MKTRSWWLPAVAAALLMTVSVLPAGSPWLLRVNLSEGESHGLAMSQTQRMDVDMGAMGRQQIENGTRIEFRQEVKQRLSDGTLVLDTSYAGMRSRMSLGGMTMEFDTESPEGSTHPMAQIQQAMKGKHFTVTMNSRGQVREIGGFDVIFSDLSKAFADQPQARDILEAVRAGFGPQAVKTMMQQGSVAFPEDAVAIGDTWRQELQVSNPALGDMKIGVEYRVEGPERLGERDCVRVGVSTTIEFGEQGASFGEFAKFLGAEVEVEMRDASGSGTAWIDERRLATTNRRGY